MIAYRAAARFFFDSFKHFGVALPLLALAGCMSAPEFPRRVSVSEVVHNTRCELYEAVRDNIGRHPWLENWAATFAFSFKVDRDLNASTDTTYLIPVQYGAFSLEITAELKQSAEGTYTLNYSIPGGLGGYADVDCERLRAGAETPQRLLNGEIGLRRWMNEVIPQMEIAWIDTGSAPPDRRQYAGEATGVGYTIEFGVTAGGSLLPSWSLTFPNGRQFRPGFNVTASRIVTHQLIVGLAPITPPGPADLSAIHTVFNGKKVIVGRRVCVTNDDEFEQCWVGNEDLRKATLEYEKALERAKRAQRGGVREFSNELPENMTQYSITQLKEKIPEGEELNAILALKQADKKLQAAKDKSPKGGIQYEEVKVAYRQSVREAQADTERRLQQIVQEQILRSAFRP